VWKLVWTSDPEGYAGRATQGRQVKAQGPEKEWSLVLQSVV